MTRRERLLKKLLYTGTHRGSKELDIILTGFINAKAATLDEASLEALDALLSLDEGTLYDLFIRFPAVGIDALIPPPHPGEAPHPLSRWSELTTSIREFIRT